MPALNKHEKTGWTIRLRLLVSFFVIFLTIATYGLYISKSTQDVGQDLVQTQFQNGQYTMLWNLKYYNRHMTGKVRGVVFNVDNRQQLRREYEIALNQYNLAFDQLQAGLVSQVDLSRVEDLERISKMLREQERVILQLVEQGDQVGAKNMLQDDDYPAEEVKYSDLIDNFLQQRGNEISEAVSMLRQQSLRLDMVSFSILALILNLILLIFVMIYRNFIQPLQVLSGVAVRFAQGDFGARSSVRGTVDEIDQLSNTFNEMGIRIEERSKALESAKENLEVDVRRRTQELEVKLAELERFNKFAVGRELKMVELKRRLRQCEKGQHVA